MSDIIHLSQIEHKKAIMYHIEIQSKKEMMHNIYKKQRVLLECIKYYHWEKMDDSNKIKNKLNQIHEEISEVINQFLELEQILFSKKQQVIDANKSTDNDEEKMQITQKDKKETSLTF